MPNDHDFRATLISIRDLDSFVAMHIGETVYVEHKLVEPDRENLDVWIAIAEEMGVEHGK